MRRKTILVDLDHTIFNSYWRDEMIGGEGGWDAYHAASCDDKCFEDIVALINAMHTHGYEIVAVTARPSKWRKLTNECLLRFNVKIDELLMRDDEGFRKSPEMKLELVKEHFGPDFKEDILFMLEDRDDVVAAFRSEGVTVLQVYGRME